MFTEWTGFKNTFTKHAKGEHLHSTVAKLLQRSRPYPIWGATHFTNIAEAPYCLFVLKMRPLIERI